jgi:hypothetical protein
MFAPGISVVTFSNSNEPSSNLSKFFKKIEEQKYYPKEYINKSVICFYSDKNNVHLLADVCRKYNALFYPVSCCKKNIPKRKVLNFTPTEQVIFSKESETLVHAMLQSKEEILTDRLNKITAVIPTSSIKFLRPLKNCLAAIRAQSISQEDINIIVTYVHNDSKENLQTLVELCIEYEAAILFHNHNHRCFPPALARNVGARRVINAITAFIDADTVIHLHTFQKAVDYCDKNTVMHVEPSMITRVRPTDACFSDLRLEVFERNMKKGSYAPGTGACIFVPPNVLEATHGYDERFIGYGATDWDFTERLKALNIKIINLSKQKEKIRAIHQPHKKRDDTNPPSSKNRQLFAQLKGRQPQRNPDSWGGIPVATYQEE